MTLEQVKANLSRGVISPYGHVRDFVIEDTSFKSKLAFGPILIQPREGMEVLCRNVGSILKTNQGTEQKIKNKYT